MLKAGRWAAWSRCQPAGGDTPAMVGVGPASFGCPHRTKLDERNELAGSPRLSAGESNWGSGGEARKIENPAAGFFARRLCPRSREMLLEKSRQPRWSEVVAGGVVPAPKLERKRCRILRSQNASTCRTASTRHRPAPYTVKGHEVFRAGFRVACDLIGCLDAFC